MAKTINLTLKVWRQENKDAKGRLYFQTKLQNAAPAADISAAGQLVMLTQRIGKSANEFQAAEGVNPESVFLLGKDLNSFKEIAQSLLAGTRHIGQQVEQVQPHAQVAQCHAAGDLKVVKPILRQRLLRCGRLGVSRNQRLCNLAPLST